MEAKILSRKLVKPASPTPDHLRTSKLSIFDQLAPHAHVPFVFFYNNFPVEGKLEHLVNSLSQTLTRFYQFAGRFVHDGYYVDCNDEGVEYIEAELGNIELSEFLSIALDNNHLVTDLIPWADIGETTLVTTPILGIKVTVFKCGGLAIATLQSHIVADGFTADRFLHDWSATTSALIGTINHEEDYPSKTATFGISSHFPARDLSLDIKPMPMPSSKIIESKIVTKRFVFNEKSLSALKSKAESRANIARPTRVEVVTSTIWKALINVRACDSKPRDSTLYLHLNLRGRTGLQLENSSQYGNFYMETPSRFKADNKVISDDYTKMEGVELHELVSLLRSSFRNTLTNCSKLSNPEDVFLEVAKNVNGIREDKGNEEVDVWLLSTLCRFPFYEFDFGWGNPEWVTTGGLPVEIVFLLDTKCGTGIEAIVNLKEVDMVQFEQDPAIIEFTS